MKATAAASDTQTASADSDEAARFVHRAYGICGSARTIACERDQIFHIASADGREFLLKIFHSDESPDAIRLETAALLHIAARDPVLPVQHVIRTVAGATEAIFARVGEPPRIAKLLSYLPGALLASVPATSPLRRQIGTMLARLDIALAGFAPEGIERELIWDMQRATALRPLLEHIDNAELRALAAAALEMFEQEKRRLDLLPKQAIHNDFNPYNILTDARAPERIGGIIDFGDMVRAPRICDLAVAASYHATDLSHLLELVCAYHAVNALTVDERALLFTLIRTRLAMSVTISGWRAKLYPENAAYILRNTPSARAGLVYLAGLEPEAAQNALNEALR
ncbi:MAG: phosphotransferase [Alphaproteobacteria bacterium]|nr:phosphotransferase [Alphaproteobacteria bacterium]